MSDPQPLPANITIRQVAHEGVESVVRLLLLAEPSRRALNWSLEHLSDTIYRLDVDGQLIGAATVRWEEKPGDETEDSPAEIVELGIEPSAQGKGFGKQFVRWMLDEGRRRNKKAMIVGARNSSIGNLAFYQKCGFRMDHVRADYFWYYGGSEVEHGIPVRDLVVFRYDFVARPETRRRDRSG